MHLFIAGATGFIGKKLATALQSNNHTVTVLGRNMENIHRHFTQPVNTVTWEGLPNLGASMYDAVINPCGYNIAASRWSDRVKKFEIYQYNEIC